MCHNGGTPRPGSCACSAAFTGTCCETRKKSSSHLFYSRKSTHIQINFILFSILRTHKDINLYVVSVEFSLTVYVIVVIVVKVTISLLLLLLLLSWSLLLSFSLLSSCICDSGITCGSPGSISNGAVSPSGSTHNYGTTVTFACNTGYRLVGGATRTCQANSQWSGTVPTCQSEYCYIGHIVWLIVI